MFAMGVVVVLVVALIGAMTSYFFGGDGFVANRTYAIAYSYKATIKGGGPAARVFDFADRNLPRTSIVVPLRDDRGMPLVTENPNLPPSTVRKVVGIVPTREVEGVTYPGYSYVEWQYHLGVAEPQSVVPVVTPSK